MRRALELALRGPAENVNPQVGCVLVTPEGRIVAEGWHRGVGTPHAEVDALAHLPTEWCERAGELTAVVSLEPCNHQGHTGPCAEALIDAGVGAVAYAVSDPGAASGGGADRLRAAGVTVRGGVLAGEVRAMLAPWFARQARASDSRAHADAESRDDIHTVRQSHAEQPDHTEQPERATPLTRPHVTVKWAQTLDGRAAAADDSSQWITGVDARGDVHRRRAEADAIVVGTGTLLADDPALTARAETGGLLVPAAEQPVPVVIGHRAIPADARVREHPALAARGLDTPLQFTGDNLAHDLQSLAAHGFTRVFVEGGPALISALIAEGLVDDVLVYVAPALLGGPGLAIRHLGIRSIEQIARLRITHFAQLGADLLIKATIARAAPKEER